MSFDAVWVGSEGHGKVASLVFLLFFASMPLFGA